MRIGEDAVYLGQRTAGDGRLSGRLSPGTLHYRPRRRVVLEVLLTLGLLIVVAKLVEGVLSRFGLSSIIAYTATGVVLGPVLGIAEASTEIQLFLGIGILVLFFLAGLDEIDIPGFVATFCGRYFVAAVLSVVVSLLVALIVTSDLLDLPFALGLGFTEALALAGILSLSSLGLVAKVLADDGHLKEPIGLKMFTIVTIAEVIALLVVGFTIGEHHDLTALNVLILLAKILGFVVVTWVLSAKLLPPAILFLRRFIRVPELSFGLLLGGLFLVVVGAEEIGLHGTIGALLFGAALSGLPEGVRHDILPGMRSASEGLFVPLFFASAGLRFDLSFTAIPIGTIAALVLIPLVGKFAGAFLSTYVTRIEAPFALATGLMAKGVAEIALLLVLLESGGDRPERIFAVRAGHVRLHPADAAGDQVLGQAGDVRTRPDAGGHAALLRPVRSFRRQDRQLAGPDAGLSGPGDHGAELRRRMGRAASSRLRGGRRWKGGGNRVDAKGAFGSGEGTDDEDAAGSAAHAGAACLSG